MSHHRIEWDEACPDCDATGLFVGWAEKKGGAAVVCRTCKGTGCKHGAFEYDDFEGRRSRTDVSMVIRVNPGIGVGEGNDYHLKDFGGMALEDWQNGLPFPKGSEMRSFTCPAWWYQIADYDLKPDWRECCNIIGLPFSRCPFFDAKANCWARWDAEHPDLAPGEAAQ